MSGSEHTAWAPGYDTSALLHQGRRARIIRASRSTSGADVVLKVLPEPLGRAELNQLRDLNGVPGVVPLLDAGTTADGDLFVVLPFYADGSFGDMLARKGPAPIQEAAAVARSVAAALGAMHGRGLLHNDVCPGNILRAGRTPVLTGFGSVHRSGEALPPPGPGSESFLHSAPEALRGGPRTPAADVYQLASTIWTMLMGHTPFSAVDGIPFDPGAYAERVLTEEPRPVTRPDISRKLRGVLTRALSKSPEDRFPTPAAFASAFEQARTSKPATTLSGATGGQNPLSGAQAPLSGPQSPMSGPQTPPEAPSGSQPPPGTGSQASSSGLQAPPTTAWFPPPETQASHVPTAPADPTPAPAPTGPPTGPRVPLHGQRFPVDAVPHQPVGPQPPHPPHTSRSPWPPPPAGRPEPPHQTTGPEGSRFPEVDAGGTAEIMMAKLRGEEISPLRAWSRLEGWTGTAESSALPVDEAPATEDGLPGWGPLHEPEPDQARWRRHLHIAVTVCGILLVTSVSSVFASTGSRTPVVAAEEEAESPVAAEEEEEVISGQVVEPTVPTEVSAPSGIVLTDSLGAVELNWTDNSGGTASFFVLGGPSGHDPFTMARTGPGVVSAQIVTADTVMEYCFTVVAVEGSSTAAEEVCTTRAADRAEAERQAEEEAAAEEEEEEEEEEDAEPSAAPSPDPDA